MVSTPAGGTTTLHVSVDLLFDLRTEGCETDTPVNDRMTEARIQSWATQMAWKLLMRVLFHRAAVAPVRTTYHSVSIIEIC